MRKTIGVPLAVKLTVILVLLFKNSKIFESGNPAVKSLTSS